MTLHLLFDDTQAASASLHDLTGVQKFGDIVFQRRSRAQAMSDAADKAGAQFRRLTTPADLRALLEELRNEPEETTFVLAPAHLAPACGEDQLVTFLRQIAYAPSNLHMPVGGAAPRLGWSLMRTPLLRAFLVMAEQGKQGAFLETHGSALTEIPERLPLVDISNERALLDFLSGQLDARHFNALERDEFTITKRSADRRKIKNEFDFYHWAPPQLQMFLIQPFDFQDDGTHASYRMERLSVPDMALQWVHGAFQESEFDRFLHHIFHFIRTRPVKAADARTVRAVQDELYVHKVQQRIEQLKAMPGYANLAPMLERACGGVDALLARYIKMYSELRRRLPENRLAFAHGDPCFSNILYSKTNQYLKLIDPRGADDVDRLYMDPYYDVAKLSHSALGDYDFINQGKFDLWIDEALRPTLSIDGAPPAWARRLFLRHLSAAGFDATITRLCEASLFISMLPLHMDRPRKVLAFAVRGASILDELETGKNT